MTEICIFQKIYLEKHWTILAVGFIIYNVLVSLRTETLFWGKRELGKEKQR